MILVAVALGLVVTHGFPRAFKRNYVCLRWAVRRRGVHAAEHAVSLAVRERQPSDVSGEEVPFCEIGKQVYGVHALGKAVVRAGKHVRRRS